MSRMDRISYRHSDTAEATAAMRATESRLPATQRLLYDPVARELVRRPRYRLPGHFTPAARLALFLLERRCPGLHGHVVLRSRYAEDAVTRGVASGIRQVVLLGAGFDTIAFRLDVPARFFEVDVPSTQRVKRQRLLAAGLTPKVTVVYTPCTFGVDRLESRLRESGFEPAVPAVFVWLGVTPYLSGEAVRRTLADVASLSAPGTMLVLDYVESGVLDGSTQHPGGRRVARMVARRGEPLRSEFTPATLRTLLEEYGFAVEEDLGLGEMAVRYQSEAGGRYAEDGWNRVALASLAV